MVWKHVVRLHRLNAIVLIVFLTAHLANHAAAALGPDAHADVMGALRAVYRADAVEPVLIGLFVAQVGLGVALFSRRVREREKGLWSWVQLVSGGYLALFVLNHLFLGVLRGRTYEGVDTGFHFVAATVTTEPIAWFFRPYYVLAVVAVFAHLAAALRFRGAGPRLTWALLGVGAGVGTFAVAAYAGAFFDVDLPQAYRDYAAEAF